MGWRNIWRGGSPSLTALSSTNAHTQTPPHTHTHTAEAAAGACSMRMRFFARANGQGSRCFLLIIRANDPSAGSPTETLLRLLLPLSDKVH